MLPLLVFPLCIVTGAVDAPDVADIPSLDLAAGKEQRYFLIGPRQGATTPRMGYGLLLVLPGGDGGEGFLPFVKRIYKNTLDEEWLAAEPVAVKWTTDQQVVWPTERIKVRGMKFTTEAFVEAVIADVGKRHRVDPARVFLLSWSSSGTAAYSLSLQAKKSVTGFYISMSVFKPETLPDLGAAKGNAYFLDHSPQDQVCPFRMARDAERQLQEKGAKVKLISYEGGHGWRGDLYGRMREGWKWLEKNRAEPGRSSRPAGARER